MFEVIHVLLRKLTGVFWILFYFDFILLSSKKINLLYLIIYCTVFLYCFLYVYLFLFVLSVLV